VLGAGAGAIVAGLHDLTKELHRLNFGLPPHMSLSSGVAVAWWRLAIIPPVVGLLTGLVMAAMHRLWPEETVDPIEANALFGGKTGFWGSVRLVIATLGSNAAGASVGMEAAYSQIGSGIFSSIGQKLGLGRSDLRLLTAAGAAGAIAAAFNAPLAGAFYGFELVLGTYTIPALAPVGLAVVAAIFTLRRLLGFERMFPLADLSHHPMAWEYLVFVGVGLVAGMLGIQIMRLVAGIDRGVRAARIPSWARPAVGGLVLAGLAQISVEALGSGHGAMRATLAMTWPIAALLALLALKVAASTVSLGVGFRGGLFSTSLVMGGLLGAAVAKSIALWIPLPLAHLQAFTMVGMAAMGTAIIGAPMTMTTLAIETTGAYSVTFGVLTGVVVASLFVRSTFGFSFATWRFHLRGVAIRGAHDVGWSGDLTVLRMMRRDVRAVTNTMTLSAFRDAVPLGSAERVFVVDDAGRYLGTIDVASAHDRELDDAVSLLVAGDMAVGRQWLLTGDESVRTALTRFASADIDLLPVVDTATGRHLIGALSEAYALRRYSEEMEKRWSDEVGVRDMFAKDDPDRSV
jgi:CIC family chloride channel protein